MFSSRLPLAACLNIQFNHLFPQEHSNNTKYIEIRALFHFQFGNNIMFISLFLNFHLPQKPPVNAFSQKEEKIDIDG